MDLNKCLFIGNLVRDPEARTTGTGRNVTNFTIAVNNRRSKDREDTLFIRCEAWNKTGEIAEQYLRKGSQCMVDGRLRINEYTTREGEKRQEPVLVVNELSLGARPRDDQGGGGGGYDRGGSDSSYNRGGGYDRGGSAPPARESSDRHYEPDSSAGADHDEGGGTEDDLPF